MPDDELKTLLKFEGDAEGAKQAAREVSEAVKQTDAATESSGKSAAGATKVATQAIQDQTEQVEKGEQGFDEFAKSLGTSEREVNALKSILARANPELAGLISIATKGEAALGALFSPIGLAAAVAVVSIGAITAAIREMNEVNEKAREKWEAVGDAAQKARQKTKERVEEAAEVLAKGGITSEEAVNKAANMQRRFTQAGFKKEAIQAAMPFAVDQAGEQVMSDEEIERLIAQEEQAPGQLAFEASGDIDRVRKKAQRRSRSKRHGGDVESQMEMRKREVARDQGRVQQGNREAMARELERQDEQFANNAEREAAIDDMLELANQGQLDTEGYKFGYDLFNTGGDRTRYKSDTRRAAERAKRMGLISGEQMQEAVEPTGLLTSPKAIKDSLSGGIADLKSNLGDVARTIDALMGWGRDKKETPKTDESAAGPKVGPPGEENVSSEPAPAGMEARALADAVNGLTEELKKNNQATAENTAATRSAKTGTVNTGPAARPTAGVNSGFGRVLRTAG